MNFVLVSCKKSELLEDPNYQGSYRLKSGDVREMQFKLYFINYRRFEGVWFGRYENGKFNTLAMATDRHNIYFPKSLYQNKRFENRLLARVIPRFWVTFFLLRVNISREDAGLLAIKWRLSGKLMERKFLWIVDGYDGGVRNYFDSRTHSPTFRWTVNAWIGVAMSTLFVMGVFAIYFIKRYKDKRQGALHHVCALHAAHSSECVDFDPRREFPFLVPPPYEEVDPHSEERPPSYDVETSESHTGCEAASPHDALDRGNFIQADDPPPYVAPLTESDCSGNIL